MSSEAFVTLATNDGYALGALVLAQSIRQVGTKRNLVILISNHLSDLIRRTLEDNFDEVIIVEELNSNDDENLHLLSRPELGITFTKINCWLLTQYTKCVFMDSDCVVLREIDDLFERDELSAASDAGWPDCFNSGVFVYRPSKETFKKLMQFASQQHASFDGGDQGLLNGFFSNWRTSDISRHLPFTYNVTANAFYSYLPAVTRFRNDIHVVHFAGVLKPWHLTYNSENEQLSGNLSGQSDIQREFFLSWWRIMYQKLWPQLSKFNQELNSNKSSNTEQNQYENKFNLFNYENLTDNKGVEVGSAAHRRAWESGHIDYFGRDSFSNIQQQLERNINAQQNQIQYHPSQQRETTPEKPTTSILKTSHKEVIPSKQTEYNHKTSVKESTNNIPKMPLKETTTLTVKTEKLSQTSINETIPLPMKTEKLSQTSIKETIPLPIKTEKLSQTSIKETIPPKQTFSQIENNHSILPVENKNSLHEHESNWKVKSTIVTAYTQGVGEFTGPTSISKVVSESTATSSGNVSVVTSTNQTTVSTGLAESNITDNGRTVRETTSSISNGNRVKK